MKLHPEYQEMIYPFYSEMYDKYPYNENDPFNQILKSPRILQTNNITGVGTTATLNSYGVVSESVTVNNYVTQKDTSNYGMCHQNAH